jgi:hypothetical protein
MVSDRVRSHKYSMQQQTGEAVPVEGEGENTGKNDKPKSQQ